MTSTIELNDFSLAMSSSSGLYNARAFTLPPATVFKVAVALQQQPNSRTGWTDCRVARKGIVQGREDWWGRKRTNDDERSRTDGFVVVAPHRRRASLLRSSTVVVHTSQQEHEKKQMVIIVLYIRSYKTIFRTDPERQYKKSFRGVHIVSGCVRVPLSLRRYVLWTN